MHTTCENRTKNTFKIEAKTAPNPLKNDADFDADFCVEKLQYLIEFGRHNVFKWTPKSIKNQYKIEKCKNHQNEKNRQMPNSLKSDAPDLERTPKVAKVIWKRDNKSSQN